MSIWFMKCNSDDIDLKILSIQYYQFIIQYSYRMYRTQNILHLEDILINT